MTTLVERGEPPEVKTGTFRFWLPIGLRVAAGSALVALLVTAMHPTFRELVENLVYSECIGAAILAVSVPLRIGRFGGRSNSLAFHVWRALVAVPVGFVVGINLAALAFGLPVGLPALTHVAPLAAFVTVISAVGFMYYFWSQKRLSDIAAANAEAQTATAEARLKLLQTQIEPHMLFNTLANLRTLVEVDALRAQQMIDQLIVYLRGTLAASRSPTVALDDEFAQLGAYLALMQIRMAARLKVEIDLPPELGRLPVPPMLLQPLVENAIKHGLEPKIEGGTVRVAAAAVGDRLRFDVEDDGVGLDTAPDPGAGYGLAHVRDRLHWLYGDTASVAITARDGGGVRVRIEVPR
jgi:signal transduction histidine kinase